MKPSGRQYFAINLLNAETRAEFSTIDEFMRFVEFNQLKSILLVEERKKDKKHFAVMHKGGMLLQDTLGYKSLEDYAMATEGGFPDAAGYYAAAEIGFEKYDDHKLAVENGITNKKEVDELKSKGYADGWIEIKAWLDAGNKFTTDLPVTNALELYRYAEASSYNDFKALKASVDGGFHDSSAYFAATEKGFTNAADYSEALKLGFTSNTDLKFSREKKIKDRTDMEHYLNLHFLKRTECKHDERVLLTILSKVEQGKRAALDKIFNAFTKEIDTYKYADTNKLPEWWTSGISNKKELVEFLKNNEAVKEYGWYMADGAYFQVKKFQERKIVIDGSNVAHNSHGKEKSKPWYNNIILLVNELKNRGFTSISIINDASLKHKVGDTDKLSELKKLAEVSESPAETPADLFLIRYIKTHHCLLVSNDGFLEWRGTDKWVLDNIDFYRLGFKITNDKVQLPDLDNS